MKTPTSIKLPQPFPHWRFYRVMLENGHMRQIRDQVRTLSQIEKIIRRMKPLDMYHSVAYYCNPSTTSFNDFKGKKAGYQQADNLILGGDLVFDIDARARDLEDTKKDALICRDWLSEKGYRPVEVFSGRGFHLRVANHDLKLTKERPTDRLEEYRKLRAPLVQEAERIGVRVDKEVTLSPKSLIRLIGSINSRTNTEVAIVDLNRFEVERVLAKATPGPATLRGNDDKEEKENQDSRTGPRLSELADTPKRFLFLGTQVFGTVNRQVILIRFPLDLPIEGISNQLETLVRTARLSPFILLESLSHRVYYALSASAVQSEHVGKLLKHFPEARAAYARFRTRHLPLPVRYVCTIGSWSRDNERHPVSRAHSDIITKMIGTITKGVICGNSHLRIGLAEIAT